MTQNYQPPVPPIGLPVQWFPHANPDETPSSATVLAHSNNQTVALSIIPRSGQAVRMAGIRYIEDPQLAKGDQQSRNSRGAWGFVPGLLVAESEEIRQAHLKIRMLFVEERKSATEIAAELGGDWTHQRVNAHLRKEKLRE